MKIKRKRKARALIFALAMTTILILGAGAPAFGSENDPPAPEGSITWGNGDTDEEKGSKLYYNYTPGKGGTDREDAEKINWLRYKEGDYAPYDFVNYDDKYGLDSDGLKQEDMDKIAASEIKDWTGIAEKIFKSGARTGGHEDGNYRYGATSVTAYHDWNYYFETDRLSHGQIFLTNWLANKESKHDEETMVSTTWRMSSSGVKHASNLSEVRDAIFSKFAEGTQGVSKSSLVNWSKTNENPLGPLPLMANTGEPFNGVYYSLVTHHTWELPYQHAMNAYAIVLYDIKAKLIGRGDDCDNLFYVRKNSSYARTNSSQPSLWANSRTDKTETISETLNVGDEGEANYSNTLSNGWGQRLDLEGGIETGPVQGVKTPVDMKSKPFMDGNWDLDCMWNDGDNENSYDNTTPEKYSIDLPPYTGMNVTFSTDTLDENTDYLAPCAISYKIALCSLSAKYKSYTEKDGYQDKRVAKVEGTSDFCTFFDSEDGTGIEDAVMSLKKRRSFATAKEDAKVSTTEANITWHMNRSDEPEKNDYNAMSGISWDAKCLNSENFTLDGSDHNIGDVLNEREKTMPMVGRSMSVDTRISDHSTYMDRIMPLAPLYKVDLANDSTSEIHMTEGSNYYLSGIELEGLCENGADYYGFGQDSGHWEIDRNKSPQDVDNYLAIKKDDQGRQYIEAKDSGGEDPETAVLTWIMDRTYVDIHGKTVGDKDLSGRPSINVYVHDPYDGYRLEYVTDEAEGIAGETLNLSDALPVKVYDDKDKLISTAASYEFADGTTADKATITDGIYLDVKEEIKDKQGKTYKIRAKYNDHTLTDKTAVVKVYPKKELTVVTAKAERTVSPAMRIHGKGTSFDLMNYIQYQDQYGDPWTGDIPEWEFVLDSDYGDAASIEGIMLTVRKPGEYGVLVNNENNTFATIKVRVVENPNQAQTPQAVEGLVYNGTEQTGVPEGEGFTVKAGKATDAGNHTAVAALEEGYSWADGLRLKKRPVYYSIDRKPVAKPAAVKGLVYNGKKKTAVKSAEGYTVSGGSATKAGNYKAVVKLDKNYMWKDGKTDDLTLKYSIAKAKNPLKVKGKTAKVKYKKLKKKTQSLKVSKVIKFTKKGQGKMSYKKSSVTYTKAKSVKMSKKVLKKYKKKVAKKIKVNTKTGKVTVKKGLKKGTYKVKVKVKAAGNGNYKSSGLRTVTFRIKIR